MSLIISLLSRSKVEKSEESKCLIFIGSHSLSVWKEKGKRRSAYNDLCLRIYILIADEAIIRSGYYRKARLIYKTNERNKKTEWWWLADMKRAKKPTDGILCVASTTIQSVSVYVYVYREKLPLLPIPTWRGMSLILSLTNLTLDQRSKKFKRMPVFLSPDQYEACFLVVAYQFRLVIIYESSELISLSLSLGEEREERVKKN